MKDSNGSVDCSTDSRGVVRIEFSHPKGNSLPRALLYELAEVITKSAHEPSSRVVLLSSGGNGAFCAGASFDELCALKSLDDAEAFFMGFGRVLLALYTSPVLTVARVQGKVVGGGVGLVCACDYSIASSSSAARLSELSIGIGPFVIGPAVVRKIGVAHFSTMAIGCDWHDAQWCRSVGLYSTVVEGDESTLNNVVDTHVTRLITASNAATRELKRALLSPTEISDVSLQRYAKISAQLALSSECQSALATYRTSIKG